MSFEIVGLGSRRHSQGLTLVELLVVLVVLIGVGGILVTTFNRGVTVRGADGVDREAGEVVTLATMRAVRDALVGASTSEPGYLQDVGSFRDPNNLESPNAADLGCLIDQTIAGEPGFDPANKRGWNGPYVVDEAVRFDGDFPIGNGFDATNDFTPFAIDDILILDGWGNPLVLGHQNGTRFYWLVSAGDDRNLETDMDTALDATRGDDIVLFLQTSDPNL
ncbi:MAG: prepilin-type N-terminal cleavage/methylation domain-containing protein [Verrucomicrobiota bacterium]